MLDLKEYWESLTGAQKFKFVLKIVLLLLGILFAVFNWQSVQLHLVFGKLHVPLTVMIVVCFSVGLITSSIFDYRRFMKKDREIEKMQKEIAHLKKELEKE